MLFIKNKDLLYMYKYDRDKLFKYFTYLRKYILCKKLKYTNLDIKEIESISNLEYTQKINKFNPKKSNIHTYLNYIIKSSISKYFSKERTYKKIKNKYRHNIEYINKF